MPSPGPDGGPPDAAVAAAAARAERVSLAAVRLAFCQHAASRRWLARQESLLHAARLRLGERPIPAPPTDDATLRAQPHAAPPNHRWVAFERATRLVSARAAVVVDGWILVPDARVVESSPRTTPRKPPPRSRLPRDDSNTPPHPPARSERPPPRVFSCRWRRGDPGEMRSSEGTAERYTATVRARGTEVRAETET